MSYMADIKDYDKVIEIIVKARSKLGLKEFDEERLRALCSFCYGVIKGDGMQRHPEERLGTPYQKAFIRAMTQHVSFNGPRTETGMRNVLFEQAPYINQAIQQNIFQYLVNLEDPFEPGVIANAIAQVSHPHKYIDIREHPHTSLSDEFELVDFTGSHPTEIEALGELTNTCLFSYRKFIKDPSSYSSLSLSNYNIEGNHLFAIWEKSHLKLPVALIELTQDSSWGYTLNQVRGVHNADLLGTDIRTGIPFATNLAIKAIEKLQSPEVGFKITNINTNEKYIPILNLYELEEARAAQGETQTFVPDYRHHDPYFVEIIFGNKALE